MRHLPAIDGLRAVAVLSVVAYHAGLPIPAGLVGVDVFFVISGYLISRLLLEEGRIDLVGFYARRARRILPAAILVVAATLVATMALAPSLLGDVARSAAAASVFLANFHFQGVTGGYWAESAETMPLLHLWSLSEQFYLAWPLLLYGVRKRPAPWLAGIAVASFALAEFLIQSNPNAAFYQMPARAWELAAGGLVATGTIRVPRWGGLMGLLLALAACVMPMPHFPGIGALPAVAGATLLIAAVHHGQRVRALELRPVVWIGLISYSLYLWHWPLLALDRASRVGDAPLSVRLGLCAAAIVLAALSYRYVETPFRRAQARPRHAVGVGLVSVACLFGAASALADTVPPKPVPVFSASRTRCHAWGPGVTAKFQPPHCVADAPKVVLWGDSYTGPWEGATEALASRQGMAAVWAVETGCPAVVGVEVPRGSAKASAYCVRKADETFAYLQRNGADTVIVATHWARLLRERPDAEAGVMRWAKGLAKVRRIVIVGATPELRDSVERCTELGVPCDIPRAEFDNASAASRRMLADLDRLPNVEVIPLGDWLCSASNCPGVRDGVALYHRDNHHVSDAAVARYLKAHPLR